MPPPRTPRAEEAYPPPLRHSETDLIKNRRLSAGIPADAPLVGVALSGGGIRSATFCLGLFQALARLGLVRHIDILSTVSGGGYFGSFLGASFSRSGADPKSVEAELSDNYSWSLEWLRNNGRFLSPNGAGDTWMAAAVAVRNWIALHVVMLTFGFFVMGLGVLVRADLWSSSLTGPHWQKLEDFWWGHHAFGLWWSPWTALPIFPAVFIMLPTGTLYWITQFRLLMGAVRRVCSVFAPRLREWANDEFSARVQGLLTRSFMVGLMLTLGLFIFALIDSLGQSLYWVWSAANFEFPAVWAMLTGSGAVAYTLGGRAFVFIGDFLKKRNIRITFDTLAGVFALTWLLFILVGLSVLACGFAWGWRDLWDDEFFYPMKHGWDLTVAVAIALGLSWWFSRSFSFVNLSSLQQVYAARIRRAYIGASNPLRRASENYSMTDLVPGDDFCFEDYCPHKNGGPLHLINVTVNETVSGKTQIERMDRKGLGMAVGACGMSVGTDSHALWLEDISAPRRSRVAQALWENRSSWVQPLLHPTAHFNAFGVNTAPGLPPPPNRLEALSLGRWAAISGAAFTTGIGSGTQLGLSLLLGLANVRLGYWWDSGVQPGHRGQSTPPTFLELGARVLAWMMPVQTCLTNEFFARFHGPARKHWYLSDGGHFENTACYELVRRRVPLIICSDAGQDAAYRFDDLANLIRKARTDFGAEIQVLRTRANSVKDDPGTKLPLPALEDVIHPNLLDVFGGPEEFTSLEVEEDAASETTIPLSKKHALLARIHYLDTDEVCWLIIVKPSLMGDEALDVIQYHKTHPQFPQEPTSDQYFDEAQWESYRKLGEHIGVEVFSAPPDSRSGWSPSQMRPPTV
jgi:hypothetical protein